MSSNPTNEIKTRLRPFGIFFEKSLTDLIKGIRSHKEPEDQLKFLQRAVQECRKEVKSPDLDTKTMAVLKLAYLEMYGFDMTWANFQVLEVMSSPKFQQKRVGYLSSLQSFRNDNDVLMLMTNLLKKDLNSSKSTEVGVALSGIANIVTTPLAQDITDDIVKMLNHSKAYVRKKAVLTMYKIFLKYPEALRVHLTRLVDKLDDEDESVVTATVTVICELSKKTPKLLVQLAPKLYDLLKTSNNNWMLIRLLKLFSSLSLVEPRLKQKLLTPVLELMAKTKASSLVFECVNCLVQGDMIGEDDHEIAKLCLEELIEFFKNNDSNLKFVGLLAFHKIGKINPDFISPYSEYILKFVKDDDVTIREKALDLIDGVIDDENLFDVVKLLMIQLIPSEKDIKSKNQVILSDSYKLNIIKKILTISSHENYGNIPSFEWYLSVLPDLLDLTILNNLPSEQIGELIGAQVADLSIRVPSIRKELISMGIKVINDVKYLERVPSVLKDIVWVIGEYSNFIKNGDVLIESILANKKLIITQLDPQILIIYIPAIVKIYSNFIIKDGVEYWDTTKPDEIIPLTERITAFLEPLTTHKHFEVQERAIEFYEFLKLIPDALEQHPTSSLAPPLLLSRVLPSFFNSWEITPIAPGSQLNITKPFELDLDTAINEEYWNNMKEQLQREDEDLDMEGDEFEEDLFEDQGFHHEEEMHDIYEDSSEDEELLEEKKKKRLERIKDDPYYIPSTKDLDSSSIAKKERDSEETVEERGISIEVGEPAKLDKSTKAKKKKMKNKIVILSDEVVGSPTNSTSTTEDRFRSLISPTPSVHSAFGSSDIKSKSQKKRKLFNPDFSNLDSFQLNPAVKEDPAEIGEEEIRKLQEKLQNTTLAEANNNQGADQNEQEQEQEQEQVIVIRKKKKKSKNTADGDDDNGEKKKKKKKKKSTKAIETVEENA